MSNVPSNPADRKKLKAILAAMTHSMQKIDDERDAMKELVAAASRDFDIPKKLINKLGKTMYKRTYADIQTENEDFELLYETLVLGKNDATDEAA